MMKSTFVILQQSIDCCIYNKSSSYQSPSIIRLMMKRGQFVSRLFQGEANDLSTSSSSRELEPEERDLISFTITQTEDIDEGGDDDNDEEDDEVVALGFEDMKKSNMRKKKNEDRDRIFLSMGVDNSIIALAKPKLTKVNDVEHQGMANVYNKGQTHCSTSRYCSTALHKIQLLLFFLCNRSYSA